MTDDDRPELLKPQRPQDLRFAAGTYGPNRSWLLRFFRRLGLQPGDRILDVGCSEFPWTAIAAHEYGLEVWACDYEMADGHFAATLPWLHYFWADIRTMEPLPTRFDLIFCRGLNPLIFSRELNTLELTRFRDVLISGLTDSGVLNLVIHSHNTGRQVSSLDWGNVTTAEAHQWIAPHFNHFEVARCWILRVTASNRPIGEPWRETPFSWAPRPDEGWQRTWQEYRERYPSEIDYLRLLARLSQKIWPAAAYEPNPSLFVLGGGSLAEDMSFVISRLHSTVNLLGHGAELPEDLAGNAIVLLMPGESLPEGPGRRCCEITYREMLGRLASRDLDMVGGDIDLDQAHGLARTLENQRINARMRSIPQLGRLCERADWPGAETSMAHIIGSPDPWRRVFQQLANWLRRERNWDSLLDYCDHALRTRADEGYHILLERLKIHETRQDRGLMAAELPALLEQVASLYPADEVCAVQRLDLILRFGGKADKRLAEEQVRIAESAEVLPASIQTKFRRLLESARERGFDL